MGGTGRKLRLGPSYNGSKVSVKSSNLNSFPSKSQTSTHAPGSSIKNSKSKKSNSVKQNLTPVHPHNDCLWIGREIKSVYKPHALPKEINNLSFRIKYSDGVELRKICDFIRLNQWTSICEKKLQFREKAWEKMRVERIPDGNLKENFISTFATYLPYVSHLPINNNKTVPSTSRNPI